MLSSLLVFCFALTLASPVLENSVGLLKGEVADQVQPENEFEKEILAVLKGEKDGKHPVLDRLAKGFYEKNKAALADPAKMKQLLAEIAAHKPEKRLKEFMAQKGITDEKEGMELFLDEKEKEMEDEKLDGSSVPPHFFHLKKEEKKKPMLGGKKGRPPPKMPGSGKDRKKEEVAVGLMTGEVEDKMENANEFEKKIYKVVAKEKDGQHPIIDKLAQAFYKDNEDALKDPAKMRQLIAKIAADKPEEKLKEFMAQKGITDEEEGMELFLDEKEEEMEDEKMDGKSVPPNFFHLKKEEKKKPMLGGKKGRPPPKMPGSGKDRKKEEVAVGLMAGEIEDKIEDENEFEKKMFKVLAKEKDRQHPVLNKLAQAFFKDNEDAMKDPAKMRQIIAKIAANKPEDKLKEFMAKKGITDEEEGMELFLDEKEKEMEADGSDGKSVPPDFFHLKKEEKKKPMLGGNKGRPPTPPKGKGKPMLGGKKGRPPMPKNDVAVGEQAGVCKPPKSKCQKCKSYETCSGRYKVVSYKEDECQLFRARCICPKQTTIVDSCDLAGLFYTQSSSSGVEDFLTYVFAALGVAFLAKHAFQLFKERNYTPL